ncbi:MULTISPECIES: cytochrome P450 [Fischerella]|uniref:Cytochrome P450 n=1 Tax=Fischerella muscicola CCMEE 5323 TaxID=2019572 RepID=A0A2N6K8E2_FISMU|nr:MULTISPECIES: cytochrome P450 [Fischerella]MBD2433835.1 cytochrome P450 [Fischerella sp. FACHB-380]PLZ93894.1 cytochrome P450 [Fischerella muscicola CCMEE 5323]
MQLPNRLPIPSFLQKLHWAIDPVRYFERAAQQYSDIFTAQIVGFGDTVVFIAHPQAIQEIFTNDRKKFVAAGELNRIMQPLLGENSLLSLDSNSHKRRRQLLMPSFHGERIRAYGQLICNIAEQILSQLPQNQPFLAHTVMQKISLQVILKVVFGLNEGERCQKIQDLMPLLLDIFRSPLNSSFFLFSFLQKDVGAWSPWGKFLRQRQQMDELVYAEIAERRHQASPERIDILSLLMSSCDENGQSMTNWELRDELMTLVFAGHETTATSMAWAFYWIHHLPEVHEKLKQELNTLGNSPDPMRIFQLPYLTAVCNETLRITPVVPFTPPRMVRETVELLGHRLEPGTVVIPSIYLTHQREDIYPQPKQFKPERFLERQFSPYEFIPFGGGARGCIGQALAMFEMKLVIGTILSRYELALVDKRPEKLQRRGLALGPANGVKMVITGERKQQESQSNYTCTAV